MKCSKILMDHTEIYDDKCNSNIVPHPHKISANHYTKNSPEK